MSDATRAQGFLPEIESTRGLAEFAVEYSHIYGVMISPVLLAGVIAQTPHVGRLLAELSLIFSSAAAVSMFSIISGFVLGRMLDAEREPLSARKWGRFVWRRFVRLVPVHVVILVLIVALDLMFVAGRPLDLSPYPMLRSSMGDFINGTATAHLTWLEFFRNATFVSADINPVTWYVNIEISLCFLLPFLHVLARRSDIRIDLIVLVPVIVLTSWWNPSYARPFFFLVYLPGFVAGLLVDSWGRRFAALLARHDWLSTAAIGAFYLVMVHLILWLPGKSALRIHLEMICGFAMLSLLVWCPPKWMTRVLELRLLRWIGRICYSSYLIHCVFLILIFRAVMTFAPQWFVEHGLAVTFGTMALVLIATFGAGSLLFLWVEQPMVRWGQQVLRSRPFKPAAARTDS